mgnify:CR=1 FL=1
MRNKSTKLLILSLILIFIILLTTFSIANEDKQIEINKNKLETHIIQDTSKTQKEDIESTTEQNKIGDINNHQEIITDANLENNNRKFFYHPDHLGSTSLVTNESGDVVEDILYLPYGCILTGKAAQSINKGRVTGENVKSTIENTKPFEYTYKGEQYTGYYDSQSKTFIATQGTKIINTYRSRPGYVRSLQTRSRR